MDAAPVHLLLVEDNPGDARYLHHLLGKSIADRFKLYRVERLSEALDHLKAHRTDLILLDLSLPDAHGIETVQRVQAAAPDVPIVVLTGYSDEAFALQAVREGAQDYLFKSQIDHHLLVRSIGYAIERHRLLRERKLAEQALKASEEFALNIIDSSLDMIIAVDNELRIVQFNPAAEHAFGYARQEVLGRTARMLYANETEAEDLHRTVVESGNCVREVLNRRKNSEVFPCLISASALRNAQGEVIGVMGICRDITERKQAEKALRKMHEQLELRVQERTAELMKANAALQAEAAERRQIEADLAKARDEALSSAHLKAEFLANMSHEIRTPMNGVLGMANLLLNGPLSKEQREYAENIRESGNALLKIINDILDFSKIEAGKLTFEVVDFDLVDAVEGTLELLAEPAQSKGIELISAVDRQVPTRLLGDPVRLRQVLTNLISNAVKFTDQGEVSVRVTKQAESDRELTLRVEVQDTGIGIPSQAQSRLFKAFSQADGSTTRKYGGTGLGLVISKQLVTMMHGQIGVASELGKGSIFWFTAEFRKQVNAGPTRKLAPELQTGTYLVVDDNTTHRGALQEQLRACGLVVDSAASGGEAFERLKRAAEQGRAYRLALIDFGMPEMDGLSLARLLRTHTATADIPLIMMVSVRQRLATDALRAVGVSACLAKPIRRVRLLECLTGLLLHGGAGQSESTSSVRPNGLRPSVPEPGTATVRILVAEDNLINQKVAMGQLRALGFEPDVVATGAEALEALRRQRYDIILMDCQMPVMDGYETTRRIRRNSAEFERGRSIHIIAMTANAMQGDREKCLAAGMNDYIGKPILDEDLKAAIDRWKPRAAEHLWLHGRPELDGTPEERAAGGAESTGDQPVDLNRLLKVGARNPKRVRQFVDLYLSEAEQTLRELERALQNGAAADVEHLAHKCRGASATCGMTAIIPALREIEQRGREGCIGNCTQLTEEAHNELGRIRSFLEDYLRTLPRE